MTIVLPIYSSTLGHMGMGIASMGLPPPLFLKDYFLYGECVEN